MPAPGKLASLSHSANCPEHDHAFETGISINDIQGDIITPFPKRAEDFIFFRLKDAGAFRKEVMPELYKHVSYSGQILNFRESIAMHKKDAGNTDRLTARFVNIAFSSTGLRALDAKYRFPDGEAGNDLFNRGQRSHLTELGDRQDTWRPEFDNQIHGVILIAAESVVGVEEHHRLIWSIAGTHAEKIYTKNGVARENHEHDEHFGWRDGISNPFIKGLHHECQLVPGQRQVEPGIIILDKESSSVPRWALNGSFLVFREIDQLVPEFHKFMKEHPVQLNRIVFPDLSDEELRERGAALRAAQFVGRWPSGAPLEVHPLEDNQGTANDPNRVNDFVFKRNNQERCPFSAHIRKMNPRLRLEDSGGHNFDDGSIMRAGITYGPELGTDEGNETKRSRGLAFVCYQANIANGFRVQQIFWANNPNFPPGGNENVEEISKGFDPLIGQPKEDQVHETADTQGEKLSLRAFITTRGGEYFFVPSMTMLRALYEEA